VQRILRPTLACFIFGFFISVIQEVFFYRNKSKKTPEKIGKWKIIKIVKKDNYINKFNIGVYKYKRKKVLIKSWFGDLKNFNYYDLLQEYFTTKLMNKLINSDNYPKSKYKLRIPNIKGYHRTKKSFSLIIEYIQGRRLSTLSQYKQAEILIYILKNYKNITFSKRLQLQDFPKQSIYFYLLSLPLHTMMSALSNLKSTPVILKAFLLFLRSLKYFKKEPLILAHRDLNPKNILIRKNNIFLLDNGNTVLTFPNYDLEYLRLDPEFEPVFYKICSKLKYDTNNNFFLNFFLIHFSKSFALHPKTSNYYLEQLHQRYGNKQKNI